jgi:hypothetical protein
MQKQPFHDKYFFCCLGVGNVGSTKKPPPFSSAQLSARIR